MRAILFISILGLACQCLGGCAGGADTFAVPAGQYDATFETARQVLRDERWLIERVDAQAGVISTQRRTDVLAGSFYFTVENLANRQQRFVRVLFAPQGGAAAPSPAPDPADPTLSSTSPDLTAAPVPLVMSVRVFIDRIEEPGRRLSTASTRLVSYTSDPVLIERGMEPSYRVAKGEDQPMAARIAQEIARRMGLSAVGGT